tara:strand:- start:7123 stop:8118 length:996 start_codon:yes stop_codon:yes gene_type:complete
MIISRTPLRVSFFGGGTDYPDFYLRSEGKVIGTAINKFVYVSLSKNGEFFDYKTRISYRVTELVNKKSDIKHPSVKACLDFLNVDEPLDINIFSDLPAKTGLGSSSAFTVGFLNALYALKGKIVNPKQLAEEACHVEQKIIKENVGSQDQFHSSFGGFNEIVFNKDSINVNPIPISNEKKNLLNCSWLMFYTGLTRFADKILNEQISKTKSKVNDENLIRMLEIEEEAKRVISDTSNKEFLKELSSLLNKSWNLKRSLSSKVSNNKIDQIYDLALKNGALGGKLSGAGSGGFVSFLVPKTKQNRVRSALSSLKEVNCQIYERGSSIIFIDK